MQSDTELADCSAKKYVRPKSTYQREDENRFDYQKSGWKNKHNLQIYLLLASYK